MKYTVLKGQSIFDIAVTCYGSVEGVSMIVTDNALKGPTDRLLAGQQLLIRDDAVINNRTRLFLQDHPVIATIRPEDMPEGIGFWYLEEYQLSGVDTTPEPGLAFIPGSVGVVDSEGAYSITLALNQIGTFTFTFRSVTTNQVYAVFEFEFLVAGVAVSFGFFDPDTYNIEVGEINYQITVP